MARDYTYPPLPPALPLPVADNHTHIEPGQSPGGGAKQLTLSEQVERAAAVGVEAIVQCGCDLESARWTAQAVATESALLGAIAIHPNEVARMVSRSIGHEKYIAALAEIADLAAATPRIRAIGETGLDYYRTGPDGHAAQQQAFRDHIALAKELGLALQIHDREAHADILDILTADGSPPRTVFHCFSGDREMAELVSARGWYVSIAGTITFSSNDQLRQAVVATPLANLLVETDAPYLTPHPNRGRPNAPYMIPATVRTISEVKQVPLEQVCQALRRNTAEVYGAWDL